MFCKLKLIGKKLHIAVFLALSLAFIHFGLLAKSSRPERVFVIHSYDESGQEGSYFQKKIRKTFKKKGISADIRHFYFDLIYDIGAKTGISPNERQLLEDIHSFRPDILLINDDAAFNYILKHDSQLIKEYPTVFAGVSAAEWDRDDYPLLCGFFDEVDLAANGAVSEEIFGTHILTTVLDYDEWDNLLRKRIYDNISDTTRYVNNGDFHLRVSDESYIGGNCPEQTIFNFISVRSRERNQGENMDRNGTATAFSYASMGYGCQIQVKYDIGSNSLIKLCPTPQLTAIREQFNPFSRHRTGRTNKAGKRIGALSGSIPFLGGYFTGIDTQIEDQVNLAVRIFHGENPSSIGTDIHGKNYFLDWNAMALMTPPLKYKDIKPQYTIVNAPFWLQMRTLSIIGGIILISSLCFFLIHILLKLWKISQKKKNDIIEAMNTERKRRILSMRGMEAEFFTLQSNLFRFYFDFAKRHSTDTPYYTVSQLRKWIDPSSFSNFNSIVTDNTKIKKDRRTRIRMDIAGEGFHWWDVYYRVSESLHDAFTGVLIKIDDIVEDEEKVKANVKMAEEVASKEYFIANITHDIRTPLNAIAGFSQIMVEGCTSEEASEYSTIISDNADQMLNLIDEAVTSSLEDVDNIANYRIAPVDIAKVASRSYSTNLVLVPSYLQFIFEENNTGEPVMINADIYYINRVINNLISNAFKYTPQGSVTFGWRLIDSGENVEIYVRDTGIGIDKKDQASVFERFFTTKNDLAGTGLGLYITKRIIDNLGGKIKLESKLGSGSTFSCILPVIKEDKK